MEPASRQKRTSLPQLPPLRQSWGERAGLGHLSRTSTVDRPHRSRGDCGQKACSVPESESFGGNASVHWGHPEYLPFQVYTREIPVPFLVPPTLYSSTCPTQYHYTISSAKSHVLIWVLSVLLLLYVLLRVVLRM
ncbi:hypothetical protein BDV59DRAFT_172664 [Aspergillus ambiguus]|uniref:uncharacterized protein n=1 Tax=Aspergillus ambiguus TaxID=176160 RepID=UPI003CCE4A38